MSRVFESDQYRFRHFFQDTGAVSGGSSEPEVYRGISVDILPDSDLVKNLLDTHPITRMPLEALQLFRDARKAAGNPLNTSQLYGSFLYGLWLRYEEVDRLAKIVGKTSREVKHDMLAESNPEIVEEYEKILRDKEEAEYKTMTIEDRDKIIGDIRRTFPDIETRHIARIVHVSSGTVGNSLSRQGLAFPSKGGRKKNTAQDGLTS